MEPTVILDILSSDSPFINCHVGFTIQLHLNLSYLTKNSLDIHNFFFKNDYF